MQRPRDTTRRGDLSEFEIIVALLRAGRTVLRPLSAGLRYDLVIDNSDGTFVRVQCKTGTLRAGAIVLRVRMSDARRRSGISYHGQVDAFAVHCPETGRSYLVPMSEVAGSTWTARLRVETAKNGQSRKVRAAERFAIRPVSAD